MRQTFAAPLIAYLFASIASAQDLATVGNPTDSDSYSVIYAGRLFGYYRYPEVQVMNSISPGGQPGLGVDNCLGPLTEKNAPEAFRFIEALQKAGNDTKGTTLRLATGDNFSPFLLARQMWDPAADKLVEKEAYTGLLGGWILTSLLKQNNPRNYRGLLDGGGAIPMDNVACFIRRAGFDAIVPGEFDFHFGPTRLRQLADFLAETKAPYSDLPATKMLGVNLYLQTKEVTTSVSQSTASTTGRPKGPALIPANALPNPPKVTTPKTALPWMRSVQIRGWSPGAVACLVEVSQLIAVKPLASFNHTDQANICTPAFHAIMLNVSPPLIPSQGYTATIPDKEPLKWDTEYAAAVVLPLAAGPVLGAWQSFTVVPPFFGYVPGPSKKAQSMPWILKSDKGADVAVFGVVDPSLMQSVGKYNSIWLEESQAPPRFPLNNHYETDLQVADPAEALKQTLEFCNLFRECAMARKVLLAQMPQQTAYNMLASFRGTGFDSNFSNLTAVADPINFDLVIAEADPQRGTGNRVTVRTTDGSEKEFNDPVVLVPDPAALFDPRKPAEIKVRVQRAIVTPGDFSLPNAPRAVRNRSVILFPDAPVPTDWFPAGTPAASMVGSGPKLIEHLHSLPWPGKPAVSDTKLDVPPVTLTDADWRQGLHELALKAVARICESDTAMIQERDVFWVPLFATLNLNDAGFRAVMDAVYWKGDYVQCMSVSGATITSVLERSQDLRQKQYYGLLSDTSLDTDWSLVTLGANEEQPDATRRLISAHLLDPKKLYSFGTTDFVGGGDTGYAALQGAEPPPETSWAATRLQPLTNAIRTGRRDGARAAEELDALTRTNIVPPSQLHQPNSTLYKWFKSFYAAGLDVVPSADPLQKDIQDRPVWSFSLYKADFGYSFAAHSGYERTIPTLFPGVSAVDLTAQDSSSITFDYLARVQRDSGANEIYAQSEMNYGYKKTRQASKTATTYGDPYMRNQTADFVYHEMGYARKLSPRERPDGWRLLLPVGIQTQLAPSISLPEGVSGPMGTFVIASPRSYYLEGRPGFRRDFSFPKPADWSLGQGGSGGSQSSSAGGPQATSSSGKGGKGGKGGGANSAGGAANAQTGGSGGAAQSSTFDSYVEFGYQFGPSIGGPKDFVFNNATALLSNPAYPSCVAQLGSGSNQAVVNVVNVVGCFNAATAIAAAAAPGQMGPFLNSIGGGRSHFQNGLYFNYRIDMPVPVPQGHFAVLSNMEIVSELRGDFFFGHSQDTPVDTHLLTDAKESLNIPIFTLFSGKFSLAPTFEMIYYANKISNNLYRSYSTSVSLNYSFDMRKGLNVSKVLGYQNPVPALPTLPSR